MAVTEQSVEIPASREKARELAGRLLALANGTTEEFDIDARHATFSGWTSEGDTDILIIAAKQKFYEGSP